MLRYLLLCIIIIQLGETKSSIRNFPKNFKFGASTAAYSIEGAWNKRGKGLSIWDVATHSEPSRVKDDTTGDIASNSYHLYKRDIELMKELGLDFYKFSISWSRILPSGLLDKINQDGLNHYSNLINDLIKNNIMPFVVMYHWDLPETLQKMGGWANGAVVEWFTEYVKILFDNYGDRVKLWITINEPKHICLEGYGADLKPPFLNMSGVAEYICAKNVLLAHAKAYRLYDENYRFRQNGQIGISIGGTWFEPASGVVDDYQAAVDARQFDWGQYAHPIFSKDGDFPLELKHNIHMKSAEQGYPCSRLPLLSKNEVDLIKGSADFFGLSSYTTKMAYRDASLEGMFPVPSYRDDMGAVLIKDTAWSQAKSEWLQEVPWGFFKILKEISTLYNNPPLYVTENGWSTDGGLLDDDRVHYIRSYLGALLDAVNDGCNIKGYSVWSLIDSFEWLQGYTEKFGLYEVDFSNPDRTRTARKSSFVYKEIIKSRMLDPDYEPSEYLEEN